MEGILNPDWNLFTHIGPNINLLYIDNRHLITTGSDGLFHCLDLERECEQKLSCNLIHKAAITHLSMIKIPLSNKDEMKNKIMDKDPDASKGKFKMITAGSEGRVHCIDILDPSIGDGGYDKGNIKSLLRTSTLIRAIEIIESMNVIVAMDGADGRGSEIRIISIQNIENVKSIYLEGERIFALKRGSIDLDSVWMIKSDNGTNGHVHGMEKERELEMEDKGKMAGSLVKLDKNLKVSRMIPIFLVRGIQPILVVSEGLIALFNGHEIIVVREENVKEELEGNMEREGMKRKVNEKNSINEIGNSINKDFYRINAKMNLNSLSWIKSEKSDIPLLFGITKDKNLYIWRENLLIECHRLNIPCEITCSAVSHDIKSISCIDEQGILNLININGNHGSRNEILRKGIQNKENEKNTFISKNGGKDYEKKFNKKTENIKISKGDSTTEDENQYQNQNNEKDSIADSDILNTNSKRGKKSIIKDSEDEMEINDNEREREKGKGRKTREKGNENEKEFQSKDKVTLTVMPMIKPFTSNLLCWNYLGLIAATNESIDIEYNDTNKRAIRFEDDRLFTMGALGESGAILANSNHIYFVPSNDIGLIAKRQGWTLNFPLSKNTFNDNFDHEAAIHSSFDMNIIENNRNGNENENRNNINKNENESIIIGVAIGRDYVWIAHENGWIRMITVNGQQKIVILGCGMGNTFKDNKGEMIIRERIHGIIGNIKNNLLLVITDSFECKVYNGAKIVATSRINIGKIVWIGFMDESDIPACMDSFGTFYIWPFNHGYDWIIMERTTMPMQEQSTSSSISPLSYSMNKEIQIPISINCDSIVTVPRDAKPRVTIPTCWEWKFPFFQLEDHQNQLQQAISKVHLLFEINILNTTLNEKERKKLQNSTDKKTLELLQIAIKQEKLEKAIEQSRELFGEKSVELAIQLARHNRLVQLADQIEILHHQRNENANIHEKSISSCKFQKNRNDSVNSSKESVTMATLSPIKNEKVSFPSSPIAKREVNDDKFYSSTIEKRIPKTVSSPIKKHENDDFDESSPNKNRKFLKADLGWNHGNLNETLKDFQSSTLENDIHNFNGNQKENNSFTSKMGFLNTISKYASKRG